MRPTTHCPRGHLYDLLWMNEGVLRRKCGQCSRDRDIRRRLKARAENVELVRARRRAWYKRHRETARAGVERFRKIHPDLWRAHGQAYRAKKRNAPGKGVSAMQLQEIRLSTLGLCSYCNERPKLLCLDHIDPLNRGGEHEPANLTPVCARCNSRKRDFTLLHWLVRRATERAA